MFICIKSSTVCDKNTTQPNYLQKIPAARSCRHRGHAGEMATEVKYSVLTMLMGEAGPLNTPQVTHTHTHTHTHDEQQLKFDPTGVGTSGRHFMFSFIITRAYDRICVNVGPLTHWESDVMEKMTQMKWRQTVNRSQTSERSMWN